MNNVVTGIRRSNQNRKSLQSVDAHVGARLRARRVVAGATQSELGAVVSITFQQVQKYENGTNRISASQLYKFSQFLNCPFSYFFEGLDDVRGTAAFFDVNAALTVGGAPELLFAFNRLDDRDREVVLTLAKLLSAKTTRRLPAK